jgi:hypothetical protein
MSSLHHLINVFVKLSQKIVSLNFFSKKYNQHGEDSSFSKKILKYATLSFPCQPKAGPPGAEKRESRVKCNNPGSPIKSGMTLSAVLLCSVFVFTFLSLLLFPIHTVQSATRTWSGAVSNLWNVDANWGGTKPSAGDDLIFPASASNKSTSNDIAADTLFNSITINDAGYTLAGNRITLGAGGYGGLRKLNRCIR